MLVLINHINSLSLRRNKLRVVVVDDNVIYRRLLSRMLKKYHASSIASVIEFECPVKALAHLSHFEVDALFMDIDMPTLQGTHATKIIRSSPSHHILPHNREIPIIAFSTNCRDEDILSYVKAGMDGFMEKPLRPSTLHSIISRIKDSII
ncbi:sensitivity to red-light reduced protein [Entomophthora muscae]|uniref:Sensitivity to red-light reduced protein n=1 Tax=Entomophthora muscae TaxID=34485 RepID=A0ACC2URP1_9FUNG|nr:sensitivity to red-light reduced protein [Entomophthora muscae]